MPVIQHFEIRITCDTTSFNPGDDTMKNYSLAILLAQPDRCRAIYGIYQPDPPKESGQPQVKRELFKTFDETITVGDIVCVPSNTRHGVTTIKVVETDVEWDVHYSGEVRWIIAKIDQANYQSLRDQENAAITQIKEAEKTHERNEMRKKMFAHIEEGDIAKLDIAHMGQPAQIANGGK